MLTIELLACTRNVSLKDVAPMRVSFLLHNIFRDLMKYGFKSTIRQSAELEVTCCCNWEGTKSSLQFCFTMMSALGGTELIMKMGSGVVSVNQVSTSENFKRTYHGLLQHGASELFHTGSGIGALSGFREMILFIGSANALYREVRTDAILLQSKAPLAKPGPLRVDDGFVSRFANVSKLWATVASAANINFNEVKSLPRMATFKEILGVEKGKKTGRLFFDATEHKWKLIARFQSGSNANANANGKYDFVIRADEPDRVYVGEKHHELSNGQSVLYAGEVFLRDGEVGAWNNRSGHFIPHPGFNHQAPFPIHAFTAWHIKVEIERVTTVGNQDKQKLLAEAREQEQRSMAESEFLQLVLAKGGKDLSQLYMPQISKKERDSVVKCLMKKLNMNNRDLINKLLSWEILKKQ